MDSTNLPYASFPFDWTVKSTTYQIKYRKAFDINEIDEIFCTIINAKGNQVELIDLGQLLGFNLQDLAEMDVLNIYLKGLTEYNLIYLNKEVIQLTEFGQEALKSKLKYKYYYATTELFENQTAIGETFYFSFKNVFDLKNKIINEKANEKAASENTELKQRLQFQLFENNIYNGEIVELIESIPSISYKTNSLQCDITLIDNSFNISIYKSGIALPEIVGLIELPENKEIKEQLIRKGMYHYILAEKTSITTQDIETYIDLWNWKELAENSKVDWSNKSIFKLFLENGDGSVWSTISEKVPIESIKFVIKEYAEYWNWTLLTARFDNDFINEQIENLNWDFEELSYKETEFVISLLQNSALKEQTWDWNYLSKNLPDKFIEENIENFNWDFYEITVSKNDVFKNTFIKYREKLETIILKSWNWKFISEEINLNFLHKNISVLARKLNWHTVLNRFFNNEEITAKCLKEEWFKSLLKQHLPENFIVAHQNYIWTPNLIDFFEQQNLIQWESKTYINGFDTNENVEWNKTVFQKYHSRITTEKGFLNVSQQISDYGLIEEFPDFAWNWEGTSQNKKLVNNIAFIEKALIGNFNFSNNLLWNLILAQSTFDVEFWNKHLEVFHNKTDREKQILFWKSLTQKENQDYIFANSHFPWDWSFITENSTQETILDSFEDEELLEKWDWQIATQKFDKETILDTLEEFARFIDWKFLINEVFTIENELSMDKQLPRIAACLSVVKSDKRKEFWKVLTAKFSFEILFPIVEATIQLDVFEWDWDFISNHKHFPTDSRTLNRFKQKINWSVFSDSKAIHQKFSPSNWPNYKEWLKNTDQYLSKFADNWNWAILSKNKNITYNRFILTKHKGEKWDWEYLSEFGGFLTKQKRDNEKYLEQVVRQFQLYIKFEFLSKRQDINIESGLILATKDKRWDWQILAENEKVELSNELILELKDKNWNWKAISKRKNLALNNETLFQLLDKDWDWNYLSENTNLEFNIELIEQTKTKSWNWRAVSRHKTFLPTVEILTLTKDFDLDWNFISQQSSLNPTKELLAKFETKWDWYSITQNPQINFSDIDFIERFADNWNWRFICESGKLALNNQILDQFKKYLKWDLISSNTNIDFNEDIIQEYKQYWNWTALKENKRVVELLGSYVTDEISKSSSLNFIDKIEQQYSQWKGHIYHFSHIDNAVEIIKKRKIQSRNKATIKGDAAGNVVHLRNDAHDYARFYFRPHTPTQFYNEFLGKNTTDGYDSKNYGWVSWYEKARGLGFPKCPIPIFFKFSLQEVLFKDEKQCCISNGNMQTGSTQFGSIEKMTNKFGFEDLYYTPQQYATKEDYNRYRNYAQQEFLVKDKLSFDDLSDFEIVCPSETDRTLLINLLGQEHKDIFSKIVVDRGYYNNENPRARIEEEDSELHISTSYNGDGYFVLNGNSDLKEIDILVGDVIKTAKDKIIFKSNVSLGNVKQNIQLNFIDESGRDWFVYANNITNQDAVNSNLWGDIISINYILNTKHNFLELEKYFYDDYNPFSIYEKIYHKKYESSLKTIIDYDKIEYVLCATVHKDTLSPLKTCKNLKSVWAYGAKDWEVFKKEIQLLEGNNLCVVFNDTDEDLVKIDNDIYFPLSFILNKNINDEEIVSLFKKFEVFKNAYETSIRHYRLEIHTLLVLNQFSEFFSQNDFVNSFLNKYFGVEYFSNVWFRVFLALHDIGKAKAFKHGDKSLQYKFSKEIILLVSSNLPFNNGVIPIYIALLENDSLGEYFQNKLSLEATKSQLSELASNCGLIGNDFLKLFMVYYQCDIAAYTADAGGIKFLEHLFEYKNGQKVFDEEEGLLKMSPKYWEMYQQLKNEIENGNSTF